MAATVTDYITQSEFRDYVKDAGSNDSDSVASAITSASRKIDSYCGRYFYRQDQVQYFSADPRREDALWVLPLDDMDLASSDALTVETTTGNDGTYPNAWTLGTDYICEPVNQSQNGITGWPYTSLRAVGGKVWPFRFVAWGRPMIRITGSYGWDTVPVPVKQACKIIAALHYKLADAPFGTAGWGAYGDIKVREIPQASALLAPYRKTGSLGVA